MITGKGITKTFTGEPILQNIEFKIGNNRKIGVVGKNGCGKSTLFKLVVGEIAPDVGNIESQGEQIGYIPQEFNYPNELVGEYLEKKLNNPYETYKIDILMHQLDFKNYDPYQEIKTLSEGQKMKLKVIEVMLKDPTVLLIDEPTNHLDIEGIMWFEEYIKNINKTVVMISHDREFLNNTVDEIWEIENKNILKFVGDYDNYKEQKLKLIDKWNEEYIRFVKRKNQLDELLKKARRSNISRSGKGVQSVKKRIEREIEMKLKEKYIDKRIKPVTFDTDITSSKLIVLFDSVVKNYDEKTVLSDLSFEIRGGEKIWLFGSNGSGKTTIVKLIMGEEKPTGGRVRVGNNLRVGYFAQKQTHLDFDKNLFDYFIEQTGCYYTDAFGALRRFMFEKDDLKKRIRNLSPGERARFAFAVFAYNDYDFLILDEPTNHLDIEAKEVIEESLKNFEGTLLLVSHDRFFVERVGMTGSLSI